ncbi:MAG: Glycerophosphocholine phosphodiesterase [Trizodia sp. TS-e1964]|nr:MAG: Glycerophosphocholine phosphodiesterase [Trizodia sp. TS-e1964]
MKLGFNLHEHKVQLWQGSYLDYNAIKTQIKLARGKLGERAFETSAERTEILGNIQAEIEAVVSFYNNASNALWDELRHINFDLDFTDTDPWDGVSCNELRYFLRLFTEFSSDLKKLQWYGTVNALGLMQLIHKIDPELQYLQPPLLSLEGTLKGSSNDIQQIENTVATINLVYSRDTSSTHSLMLDKVVKCSYPSLNNSAAAYEAIRKDNVEALGHFIQKTVSADSESHAYMKLIHILIQLAISHESGKCFKKLLAICETTCKTKAHLSDIITRIVVGNGHQPLDGSSSFFKDALAALGPDLRAALLSPDVLFNRLPLHYSVKYGQFEVIKLLLGHMQGAGIDGNIPSVILKDYQGVSPLDLAISSGYEEISNVLLEFHLPSRGKESWKAVSGALLIATAQSLPGILNVLLTPEADINYQDVHGETALYISARSSSEESVKILLSNNAHTDIAEKALGWTPLITASARGYTGVVELLIQAGADLEALDLLGWSALDHATFRGHITVAKKLRNFQKDGKLAATGDGTKPNLSQEVHCPVRAPLDESLILVNLGSLNSYKSTIGLDLDAYQSLGRTQLESQAGLALELGLKGGTKCSVDLPIIGDRTNQPFTFRTKDPKSAQLIFKIRRSVVGEGDTKGPQVIGSGVALLASHKQGLGPTRESLIRDYSIPILAPHTLEPIGTINFSFLLVKPLIRPKASTPARNILWKGSESTKVVGHRGLGQNVAAHKNLSIGENTTQSFLSASKLGADWVEAVYQSDILSLDVQLTKDHVPVVYHDFLVSETGTDAWMHNISLEQFMHISEAQMGKVGSTRSCADDSVSFPQRRRSYSFDEPNDHRITDLTNRMKHTFEYKQKGFKGNTRGSYIHEPFITLRELLSKTPDSLPLNIEISKIALFPKPSKHIILISSEYPMLYEAQDDWNSDLYAIEANLFVDTILSTILDHPSSHNRPIMFSSFSPEICILSSLKQSSIPVFFLNDSGNWPTGDVRASSLQQALHFASRWALDGVVMASEAFVYAPRLVGVAKARGLATASYGALNNEPHCAQVSA